jgi:hypothetical protein
VVARIAREKLHRRWVHSHEEDTDTEMVFRPASYDFPRSRGRVSFELAADGALHESGIAPTDRPEPSGGTWELEETGNLVLHRQGGGEGTQVLHIVSVEDDRLVLDK